MKNHSIFKWGILISGILLSASVASAQYFEFNIPDIDGGTHNNHGVSSFGTVDFESSTIELQVTNNSLLPGRITGFWILKPVTGDVVDETAIPVTDWTAVNALDNNVRNIIKNEVPVTTDLSAYFGAVESAPGDGGIWTSPPGATNTLAFSFDLVNALDPTDWEAFNWDAYLNPNNANYVDTPKVIARYQTVAGVDSSVGWGGFEETGDIPPIPEPSEIAFMALLGLGGIVWMRKRFLSKPQKG